MSDDAAQPFGNRSRHIRIVSFAMAVSIIVLFCVVTFLPHGRHHDEGASRPKCASNLHQIGLGILLYSLDHGGQYPDSLQALVLNEQLDAYAFICPSSNGTPSTAPTTQALAEDLIAPTHLSYIYVGSGLNDKTVSRNTVVAYEPLSNHLDGMYVLLGDGHVEFVNVPRGQAIIAAAATTRPVMLPP